MSGVLGFLGDWMGCVLVRSLEFRSVPEFSPSNLRLHTNFKYPQPLLPSPASPYVSVQPEPSSVTLSTAAADRWLGNTTGNGTAGVMILAQTNHGRHHVCLGRHPGWTKSPRESEYNLSAFFPSFPTTHNLALNDPFASPSRLPIGDLLQLYCYSPPF
jgi:hypothetical protein